MKTENWIDLNDIQAVAIAQSEGWEIERYCGADEGADCWISWDGTYWEDHYEFRGRPRHPKTREVKMECFLIDGELRWRDENLSVLQSWIRQPHLDLIVKVPE